MNETADLSEEELQHVRDLAKYYHFPNEDSLTDMLRECIKAKERELKLDIPITNPNVGTVISSPATNVSFGVKVCFECNEEAWQTTERERFEHWRKNHKGPNVLGV